MFAVFPLNIVVLPDESIALHLFEPRYKQLFSDFKNGKEFAIVNESQNGLDSYGTLVYIEKVINEYPDETVDLIVKGSKIIRIKAFHKYYPKKLYSAVEAERIKLSSEPTAELLLHFNDYLKKTAKKESKNNRNLFQIANRLELPIDIKSKFLALDDNPNMNQFLINQIRFDLKVREQEKLLNNKFHLN